MRQKIIVGNWKMFTTLETARELGRAVAKGVGAQVRSVVAVCPPFPYLQQVGETLRGTLVGLGAQNLYPQPEGAFTGEVSPFMLRDVGCQYVIIGHSERRHKLGESNALIRQKVAAGLGAGLKVILCLGETLGERQGGQTERVIEVQLREGLEGLAQVHAEHLILAYEPVWAIGTGQNATPYQAQEVHAVIRRELSRIWGETKARAIPIQYGGSVKPDNAAALLGQPDVDGALVGGASLNAAQFLAIVHAGEGS
jgi:triosephosphate isomerase (TIM)